MVDVRDIKTGARRSREDTRPPAPSGPPAAAAFSDEKAERFGEHILGVINQGATALALSLGHRAGLFDRLAEVGPTSSQGLADAAGLDERYVREWLAAVTCARVVEHDPDAGTYHLPPEHAACLTRAAVPGNLAAVAQYVSLMGAVEDGVLRCFREGGGLPYEAYPHFHEVMAEDSGQTVVAALGDILQLVPGLEARLSAGLDVLDVGCGRGRALDALARRFPRSRFLGIDFSGEAVAWAREASRDLPNLRFEVADAAGLGFREAFDVVTAFDAIHDQARPRDVLRNVRRALRPGGVFLMQDIGGSSRLHENLDHPVGTLLYLVSTTHCMSVSLAAGGEGLGTMWGEQTAHAYLADAGFGPVVAHHLPHDFMNVYFVAAPWDGAKAPAPPPNDRFADRAEWGYDFARSPFPPRTGWTT